MISGFDSSGSRSGGVCFPSKAQFLLSMCLSVAEQSVLDGELENGYGKHPNS